MLGQPPLGEQIRRLERALSCLTQWGGVDKGRITVWGDSFSEPNPPGRRLDIPLDLTQPRLAEPLGARLALLSALIDDRVWAVRARGGLVSHRSLLARPFVHVPYDAVVPGAATAGDLADVVAALAPRKVILEGMVDGLNRKVPLKEVEKAFEPARKAYREAKAEDKLRLRE
jgi:hypothetical protein